MLEVLLKAGGGAGAQADSTSSSLSIVRFLILERWTLSLLGAGNFRQL